MIKTKIIQDAVISCEDRLDTKINKFIQEYDIKKVVDIKFASINNRATALIIYEVKE